MKMTWLAGVDEAGRGCVIGPLVIAAFAVDAAKHADLSKMGVKDSKLLSPSQRSRLNHHLIEGRNFVTAVISAKEITEAMLKKISLNEIEAIYAAKALNELEKHQPFEKAILDSPDKPPAKYGARVKKYYAGSAALISENKADYNYPVVGAASILAKVERDRLLREIEKKTGLHLGSGYSHDPVTIEILKSEANRDTLDPYLRHEWETMRRYAKKPESGGLADYL